MKYVINNCYGGFSLSKEAFALYRQYRGIAKEVEDYAIDIERNDSALVRVVEEMGKESWGDFAELKIVEVPSDVEVYVDEYDGMESIHEVHRSWG